ncbi:MAG: hypothetical protein AB9869_11650 [Verrucomicrobiia bacterium]
MYETEEDSRLVANIQTISEAVNAALPLRGDPHFHYARALKAFEVSTRRKLTDADLRNAYATWWTAGSVKLDPQLDNEEHFLLFRETFHKVRTPLGANPLEAAIRHMAKTSPPVEANGYSSAKLKRLTHLCHELQKLTGDEPFFLSCRDAARVAGCKHGQAAEFLNALVRDKILILVSPGIPGRALASRYRYSGGQVGPSQHNVTA